MTDKQLTPKERMEAFHRKSDVAQQLLSDAVQAFTEGKITQKELKAREKEADKFTKELRQLIRDERQQMRDERRR